MLQAAMEQNSTDDELDNNLNNDDEEEGFAMKPMVQVTTPTSVTTETSEDWVERRSLSRRHKSGANISKKKKS